MHILILAHTPTFGHFLPVVTEYFFVYALILFKKIFFEDLRAFQDFENQFFIIQIH